MPLAGHSKLAAIMVAEVADYDRLLAGDRAGAEVALQHQHHAVIDPAIATHGGRTFELEADHTIAEFVSPVDAVRCARQIQAGTTRQSGAAGLRIGIHFDEVVIDGRDLSGPGRAIATRLKDLAAPGEICVSRQVRDKVQKRLRLQAQDLAGIPGRYVPRGDLAFRLGPDPRAAGAGRKSAFRSALRFGLVVAFGAAAAWLVLSRIGAPPP